MNYYILGHKDSVTSTGFSHDGVYVATADLGGLVKVWKVETKEEIWSFECSDIEVCGIHYKNLFIVKGTCVSCSAYRKTMEMLCTSCNSKKSSC